MSEKRVVNPYTAPAVERLPWPLPAMLAWVLAWATLWLNESLGARPVVAVGVALALPAVLAARTRTWSRRLVMVSGFPASLAMLDTTGSLPAWMWLIPLGLLLSLYPFGAWRDAPLFPTAPRDLSGLAGRLSLARGARMLDAGCGLGHGLCALRREWPHARLVGIEQSWLLASITRLVHPSAKVRHADMWANSWTEYDLVYLFQRPESMPRAWRKACSEMRPGTWLISLEFEIEGVQADLAERSQGRRSVFAYRVPSSRPATDVHSCRWHVDNAGEHAAARGCLT